MTDVAEIAAGASERKVKAIAPDARLSHVPHGAGVTYGRTVWHYHVWRPHPTKSGEIESLSYIPRYGNSEASAWKAALAYLTRKDEA